MLEISDNNITHKNRWKHYAKKIQRVISETIFGMSTNSLSDKSDRSNLNHSDQCLSNYDSFSDYIDLDTQSQQDVHNSSNVSKTQPASKKKIGLLALVVLIYYEVSGGPFGIEDIVRAGGPFYALLGFSLFLIWVIPEALITAELSTAMPEASGSVAWVDCAFGAYWAFQKGWLSWLSGVTDNALYPILFLDCLVDLLTESNESGDGRSISIFSSQYAVGYIDSEGREHSGDPTARCLFIITTTAILTYLNYKGLDVVGSVAIVICLLSLLPFVVFCCYGAWKIDPQRWLQTPEHGVRGVDWSLLLNTFFWNINFWESAACFSGEVKDPSRDYPLGIALAVLLVFISLFIPILIATGASSQAYTQWTDGYFIDLAKEIVGPWLAYWMMLASALSNIGMFEAEMSSDSWQIAGMADRGILPSVLGTRSCHDTPIYGILLSATGVICLGWMSFGEVVAMLNLLYCYSQLIEFAAFIYLRIEYPHMPRPFRIPIGNIGVCILVGGPTIFIGIVIYFSSQVALLMSLGLCILGGFMYYILQLAKHYQWCQFDERFDDIIER